MSEYTVIRCPVCMGTGELLSMVGQHLGDCQTCNGLCYVRVAENDLAVFKPGI